MNNRKVFERVVDSHLSFEVEKLFWIATCYENSSFRDAVFYEIDTKDWDDIPLKKPSNFDEIQKDKNDLIQLFIDQNLFGFLAQVCIPVAKNFTFDEHGTAKSWSTGSNFRQIWVYGETPEDILTNIERRSIILFNEFIQADTHKKTISQ